MFDSRDYSKASPEEREETQLTFGMVCLGFLAVIALVVQLVSGFMVAWTVIGSVCLILSLALGCMLRMTSSMRQNRF